MNHAHRRPVARATAALLVSGLALAASPAQAATTTIAAPNGMVGVAQSIWVNAPGSANATVPVTFSQGAATATSNATLNARGVGQATWTPTTSGSWTVAAVGASTSMAVSVMPTETTLLANNSIGVDVATSLVVRVAASAGTLTPAGSVTVTNYVTSAVIGTGTLTPVAGSAVAQATISWTPTSTTTYPLRATFTPASGSGFGASLSPIAQIPVVNAASLVTLRIPYPLTAGTPTPITAVITDWRASGTVAFSLARNGTDTGLSASLPTSNGQATLTWTPANQGNQILEASFTGTLIGGSTVSGVSTQIVNVQGNPPADPMSVIPAGQSPLMVGTPGTLRNGQPVNITSTSGSRNPVTLSASGSCAISGTILFATANKGTCNVTAFSPGSQTFDPNTATFTLNLLPKSRM